MNDIESLPSDYNAFDELVVCSNKLVNVLVPVTVSGKVPFLVGKGPEPLIWLNMPSKAATSAWQPLVRANLSLHRDIKIVRPKKASVQVFVKGSLVIQVIAHSVTNAEIERLDLRPVGLNIHGDTTGLYVGNNELKGNTFQNLRVMVGVG